MVKHVTQWLCVVEILVLLLWKIRKPQGTESPQQDQQVEKKSRFMTIHKSWKYT